MFPDWLAPWMRGSLTLGPSINIDWELGDLLDQVEKEWWKGPNVCVHREEKEEDESAEEEARSILTHHVFTRTECDETATAYKCVTSLGFNGKKKTYITVYECCHGFVRVEGRSGCPKEFQLTDIVQTLRDQGSEELAKGFDRLGLSDMLVEGNFTVFAPTDEAFKLFKPEQEQDPNVVVVSPETRSLPEQTREMLLSHVVPEYYRTSQLSDEQVLKTINPGSTIRINFYDRPRKLVTANCAPVGSPDNMAENGVVHSIGQVLTPVHYTLIDLVSRDPELNYFKTLLGQVGLVSQLKQPGQYTLLAATNSAFGKLDESLRKRIMSGHACVGNLVRNHLLPNVICSSVIEGRARALNVLNSYVPLSRNEEGKLFVGKAQVVSKDIMGTNGVLHIIDEILIPDEALDVVDVAEREGTTEFLKLARSVGFNKRLQNTENFTLFLPTNEAIQDLPQELQEELTSDPELMTRILEYHVAKKPETCTTMYSGQKLDTLNQDHKITIQSYHSAPFGLTEVLTAQCAPVKKRDMDTCNGVVHLIDKVLLPPKGDLLDTLALDSRFSTLVSLLKKADMAEGLQQPGPLTFFAPTNKAFEELGQGAVAELAEAPEQLRMMLQHHIVKGYMCCAAIFPGRRWPWNKQRERTFDGHMISFSHSEDGISLDDELEIATCDLTASNGVVHAIDKVLSSAFHRHGQRRHGNRGRNGHKFWDFQSHLDRVMDSLDDIDFPWDEK